VVFCAVAFVHRICQNHKYVCIVQSAGRCFRLYTEDSFAKELPLFTVPEISRCNITSVVLHLLAMGVQDVLSFDFIDRPPRETLRRALEQLYALGAVDENMALTNLGAVAVICVYVCVCVPQ